MGARGRSGVRRARKDAGADWRSDAAPKRHIVRKLIACVAIALALGVLPVFVNSAPGYIPILTYLLLLPTLYVYVRMLAARIDFGGISDRTSCPRNTNVRFKLRFRNRWILPCMQLTARFRISDIFGADDVVRNISTSIPAREACDVEFAVCFAHIGRIRVGIDCVEVSDPFGLFTRVVVAHREGIIEVTPRIFRIDDAAFRMLELTETTLSMTPFQKDGMDYMQVRDYVWGDPMKTIHWNLSARTGDLYTKLFETSGNPGLDLVVDLNMPRLDTETLMEMFDTAIEASLSIHEFAIAHSFKMEFLFYGQGGSLISYGDTEHINHRDLLREIGVPWASARDGEASQILAERMHENDAPNNLIVLTCALDADIAQSLIAAKSCGRHVLCLAVTPEHPEGEYASDLRSLVRVVQSADVSIFTMTDSEQVGEVRFE